MSQRTERIDELLREEIGVILSREIKDPRIGFATVTSVDTAPDLSHAKVWVSVIGSDAEQLETLRALQGSMHFVRRELGHRLHLRRIPELHVHADNSMARGTRILHLINELEEGRDPTLEEASEPLPTPEPLNARTEPADPKARRPRHPTDRRAGTGRPGVRTTGRGRGDRPTGGRGRP